MNSKIITAIIVDNNSISKWQDMALKEVNDLIDVKFILNCTNTRYKKNILKFFFYYILNIFCYKNRYSKKSTLHLPHNKISTINFKTSYKGIWQNIPSDVIKALKKEDITLVLKFGIGLLKTDNLGSLDILSFHHGDPNHYRGRPAGFYESYFYEEKQGIIVQKLSNKLDGGIIYDLSYLKIFHHSFKKSIEYFYQESPKVLRKALINYSNSITIDYKIGKLYKLPSNKLVIIFLLKLIYRKLKRILYGLFYEKRWNIVELKNKSIKGLNKYSICEAKLPEIHKKYTFYSDPFYSSKKTIFVEAVNKINGLGDIIEIDLGNYKFLRKVLTGSHFSYPSNLITNNSTYLFPEVASFSNPFLLKEPYLDGDKIEIEGMERLRIVDGTIYLNKGLYFLFFGLNHNADSVLNLYYSDSLYRKFSPHPKNPIVINPKNARMAGQIISYKGKVLRMGQNNCYGYGEKLTINQIIEISEKQYTEKLIDEIQLSNFKGPHTLNINNRDLLIDFYKDKFSFLAGYRRVVSKFSNR